jgi:anti-sigma B factor antagonist
MTSTGPVARPAAVSVPHPHDRREGRVAYEVISGVPVVMAPVEIDITNAPELRSALVEAAAHGRGTLVVDMTRTLFCDSSGLHTLVAAYKRAQAEGGELRLAMRAGVLRVFELTGVDRVIATFTSVEQALAHRPANEPNGGPVTGSGAAAEPIQVARPWLTAQPAAGARLISRRIASTYVARSASALAIRAETVTVFVPGRNCRRSRLAAQHATLTGLAAYPPCLWLARPSGAGFALGRAIRRTGPWRRL